MSTASQYLSFIPLLVFLTLFLGSGIWLQLKGVENAFYQISPTVCALPALMLGIFFTRESYKKNIAHLLKGMGHPDIITMCFIFLLAGAFGELTRTLGAVDSIVQLTLEYLPSSYLLVGAFIISSILSTVIGTSMGTIALVTPIATNMAAQGAFPAAIGVATVISGAMFGDNLSVISDTTIAAITSQNADPQKKFRLNAIVAFCTALLTILMLIFVKSSSDVVITNVVHSPWKLLPYAIVFVTVIIFGLNVFAALLIGIFTAFILALYAFNIPILTITHSIYKGLTSMDEILILSLFVGALSGLLQAKGGTNLLSEKIEKMLKKRSTSKYAEGVLAGLASVFDALMANNVLAIVLIGGVARDIAQKFRIPPHRSAYILDTFACVFQGVIPYGAQILLASSLSGVAIFQLVPKVYYCYFLFFVAVIEIHVWHYRRR